MPPFPVPADLPVIRSQFEFIKEVLYKEEKPYFCGASLPPEKQHLRTNEVFDTIETNITDLRGYENLLSLDEHLVQFVEHDSKYVGGNGLSTPENLLGYINETSGLIKAVLGADQCVCYSYRFRSSEQPEANADASHAGTQRDPEGPAIHPHTDQTKYGGLRRVQHHLGSEEVDRYLKDGRRIRIVNAWRPTRRFVKNYPLGFIDPSSVKPGDLIAADQINNRYIGEIYLLCHRGYHRWYWLSQHAPHELLLFTSFDTHHDSGQISGVPHSSFKLIDGGEPRNSIELRVIVIDPKPWTKVTTRT